MTDDERVLFSFKMSAWAFLASFVIFNIAFDLWAVWRYPHNNSMAGLSGFFLGLPVGVVFSVIGFIVAYYRSGRKT